uniref:Uncharacterized protein n=1 Tax=uncultured microorganism TaxID=358574 RepID=I2FJG9_9ZZZZ|nr:hypothetical protein [uncultured microorganism]
MMALGHASITTKGVTSAWTALIEKFDNEVAALLYAKPDELAFIDNRIVDAIMAFRNGEVIIHPGGGGEYGHIELPNSKSERTEPQQQNKTKAQSSLFDF